MHTVQWNKDIVACTTSCAYFAGSFEIIDRMLNYVIWAAVRNACMDLWSRIRTCSGKSFGLLWLLVLLTAGKSWKMSTIQVIF